MAEKISVQIALDGGEEILRQLEALGEAGRVSFKQLGDAASQAGEGLAATGEAGQKAAEGIAQTGEASEFAKGNLSEVAAAADKASESMRGLSLEAVKTSSEIAKNAAEIAKYGVEIGLLVKGHQGFISGLFNLVSGLNGATTAARLLVPEITALATGLGIAVAGIAALAVAFEALEKAATAAAKPYEKLNHDLQLLAESSVQSFASLQRGEALFGQIGIAGETFRGVIGKIAEAIRGLDVGKELQRSADQATAAADRVLEAEKRLLEAQIARERAGGARAPIDAQERLLQITRELESQDRKVADAERALADAREKAAEAAANSLGKILEIVKAIEAGQKGLTFDSLTKADTVIKAVGLSLKEAADNGQNAGKVLVDFIANADRLSAIQVGRAFGLSEEDVDRIKRLGGHLNTVDQIWKRIQGAGVLIPPEAAAEFERMRTEIQRVDGAWARLQQAWDSSIFARFAAQISSSLNSLKADFISWVASVLEAVNTAFSTIPDAVDASLNQIKSVWFSAWAEMAEGVASFFEKIGLSGPAQQLKGFAEDWKEAAQEAAKASAAAGERIRQAWEGSAEAVQKSGQKVKEAGTDAAKAWEAAGAALRQQWINGTISLEEYKKALLGLNATTVEGKAEGLRQQWINGTISLEEYKKALAELKGKTADATQKLPDPFTVAKKGADQYKQKLDEIGQKTLPAPTIDWSKATNGVQGAVTSIQTAFSGLTIPTPSIDWNSVALGAQEVITAIQLAFSTPLPTPSIDWNSVALGAQEVITAIQLAFSTPLPVPSIDWNSVALGAQEVITAIHLAFSTPLPAPSIDWSTITNGVQGAVTSIQTAFSGLTIPAPSIDWNSVALGAQEVITAISVAVQTAWQNIAEEAQTAARDIGSAFSDINILDSLGGQIDSLISKFRELALAARAAAAAVSAIPGRSGGGGGGLPFARGGFVGGRGTGTSDSNLAWLSRGEYVTPARAVRQPGVLAFLEALRRSGGNLSRVLDGMGRFALGGMMAPRLTTIPAFAKGGLNGSGSSRVLNLTIGTETFRGLSVPEHTAQALERFAVHSQIASTGKKPSWKR